MKACYEICKTNMLACWCKTLMFWCLQQMRKYPGFINAYINIKWSNKLAKYISISQISWILIEHHQPGFNIDICMNFNYRTMQQFWLLKTARPSVLSSLIRNPHIYERNFDQIPGGNKWIPYKILQKHKYIITWYKVNCNAVE